MEQRHLPVGLADKNCEFLPRLADPMVTRQPNGACNSSIEVSALELGPGSPWRVGRASIGVLLSEPKTASLKAARWKKLLSKCRMEDCLS
jgi:hypothetical protein